MFRKRKDKVTSSEDIDKIGKVESYYLDDNAYLEWLERHPSGYVFNLFGGNDENYNKMHHASCYSLFSGQQGQRTSVQKLCSDDLQALEKIATQVRGDREDWTYCKRCF